MPTGTSPDPRPPTRASVPGPLPSPVAVFAAARRIADVARRTPLTRSAALSEAAGGDVFLKRENEQVTGSFKVRGAYNAIAVIAEADRERGVVASSAGNHGLGVAFAARRLGVPATVFVPSTAPAVKRDGIRRLGAIVDSSQPDYDAAMALALAYARERRALFVNPCLGDDLLAGQGTVALEILSELPEVATVVVSVGGGGLAGGVAGFLRPVAPHVRLAGAQSVETAAMARSLAAGRVVEIPSTPTLADGLAGQVDDAGLAIGRAALNEVVTVSEAEIAATIALLAAEEGMVVEGSGAAAAAAVLHGRLGALATPAAVVVSGGNIDPARHEAVVRAGAAWAG